MRQRSATWQASVGSAAASSTDGGGGGGVPGLGLWLDAINSAFSGGSSGPNRRQVRALVAAGATAERLPAGRGRQVIWTLPDGVRVSNPDARWIAQVLLGYTRNVNHVPVPARSWLQSQVDAPPIPTPGPTTPGPINPPARLPGTVITWPNSAPVFGDRDIRHRKRSGRKKWKPPGKFDSPDRPQPTPPPPKPPEPVTWDPPWNPPTKRPGPIIDPNLPDTPIIRAGIGAAARVLGGIVMVLWPSETDGGNVSDAEVRDRARKNRRPRPGRMPADRTPTIPAPENVVVTGARPQPPGFPSAGEVPRPTPTIDTGPAPSIPTPTPTSSSTPTTTPRTPTSSVPTWLPQLLGFASNFRSPSNRTGTRSPPTIPPTPRPPLTPPQTGAPESNSDRCRCNDKKPRDRKKKRDRGDRCTNPIVSKRKRTKDGRTLITITREQKCPASSRKKLPSPLAR